jgi:endonuclease YncB( thermonuclease family)
MNMLRAHLRLREIAAASLLALCAQAASAQSAFSGIGRAKDGDSLTVGNREVRLYGIDAPEWDQTCKRYGRNWACGQVAAEELARLITGKELNCVAVDTDQYHRTVARCAAGDVDVNRTMVALGYAIAYRRYSSAYVSAEDSARVNRRGLWAGAFEMPSLYRRGARDEPVQERSRKRSRQQVMSGYRPSAAPNGGCNIKGNRGSHGWIYHLPGTPYYDRTRAEEWFCTQAQARAAGYRQSRAY